MMRALCLLSILVVNFALAAPPQGENHAELAKMKAMYIAHTQKKVVSLSQTTTCMAESATLEGLRSCAKKGKDEVDTLDKKADEAHKAAKVKK
ncbi:MAG: hypothetical protein IT288_11655 [Bdellovibrionales bacterium]|nr:hypothetical protein [Bdellovibrionales bacterium]